MAQQHLGPRGDPALIVVTGLPGTGKTTLARTLALRHGLVLLAKDGIKEPLADVLRGVDSGTLSDAAFAVLFRLAHEQLVAGNRVLLEGNFRAVAHALVLGTLSAAIPGSRTLQILCRVPGEQRRARLTARECSGERHGVHSAQAQQRYTPECDEFISMPGGRLLLPAQADVATLQELASMHVAALLAR